MVHLTKIYTRTGDRGTTRLSDNSVAAKTDARVCAYGDVDEANSAIGVALTLDPPPRMSEVLRLIQNEMFDVGADLSTPLVNDPEWEPLRIIQSSVDRLESWCDEFSAELSNLTSFILPGGTPLSAQLHICRTLARRAERSGWVAAHEYGTEPGTREEPGGVHELALVYLNRLSDLMFILARAANDGDDVLWIPGGDRNSEAPKKRR